MIEIHGLPPRTHVMKVGETVCLGRGREATIRIDDARVSRQHVNITLTPFGLEGEDLGRRNGTLPAKVKSPHVVEVFDVRVCEDRAYIIMELVQGSSVKDRLQKGPIPLPEALRIAEDIARAHAVATTAGIVHRDVTPGNILLD